MPLRANIKGSYRSFQYNGLVIGVNSCDLPPLLWLEEFLAPQFEVGDNTSCDCKVSFDTDPEQYEQTLRRGQQPNGTFIDCFSLDREFERHPLWRARGDGKTIFDKGRKVFYSINPKVSDIQVLTKSDTSRSRIALMRVVRELATAHSQRAGDLHVHGAAFAVGDKGIVISGPKGSGKTALLIHTLQAKGTRYITNDRVFVILSGIYPVIRGMPTIVGIPSKTLEMFPQLHESFLLSPYDRNQTIIEAKNSARQGTSAAANRGSDWSPSVSAAQLCDLLGVVPVGQAKLSAFVFPRVSRDVRTIQLKPLPPEAAALRLAEGLFRTSSPPKTAAAFIGPGDRPLPDEATLPGRCRALVSQVRCFDCQLGPRAYQDHTAADKFVSQVT